MEVAAARSCAGTGGGMGGLLLMMGEEGCDDVTELEPLFTPGGTGGGRRMAAAIAAEDGDGGVELTGDEVTD